MRVSQVHKSTKRLSVEELQDPLSSIYPCLFGPGALAGEEKRNKLTGDDEMTIVLLLLLSLFMLLVMVMVKVMMVVVMGSYWWTILRDTPA